jgi:hypothetical protein
MFLIAQQVFKTAITWLEAKWAALFARVQRGDMSPALEPPLLASAPSPATALAPPTVTTPVTVRRRPSESEPCMMWSFRRDILDRLDEYFVCFKRLRKHDPESYALFRRVGLSIPADWIINGATPGNVEKFRHGQRPTFGGIAVGGLEEDTRFLLPSFFYFCKTRPSPSHRARARNPIQFFRGDVYALVAIFDDRKVAEHWKAKFSVPVECHLGVSEDGTITLLKERVTQHATVVTKRKRIKETLELQQRHWRYPLWMQDVERAREDPNAWAASMLIMALRSYVEATNRIVIRVRRDGHVATFGIDLPRAKYFFRDRDRTEVAADGKRKRIFHSVVSHQRLLSGARTTQVRDHYRGARTFDWKGYHVHIVWPENRRLMHFDIPGRDIEEIPERRRRDWISSPRVGTLLQRELES